MIHVLVKEFEIYAQQWWVQHLFPSSLFSGPHYILIVVQILTSMPSFSKCSFTERIGTCNNHCQRVHKQTLIIPLNTKSCKNTVLPPCDGKCQRQGQQMHLFSWKPLRSVQQHQHHYLQSREWSQHQRSALLNLYQIPSLDLKSIMIYITSTDQLIWITNGENNKGFQCFSPIQ